MVPPHARCLSCGYLLRGLPEPVCPECARAFDPADPSTFDADPRKRRRRRWLIRSAAALSILALAAAMLPRGVLKASVTFTCTRCNRTITVKRWQLKPPSWIPFPYPGINSRNDSDAGIGTPTGKSCDHLYDSVIRSDLPIGGWAITSGPIRPGQVVRVKRLYVVSPDTAPQVLRTLLKPDNNGISVGP